MLTLCYEKLIERYFNESQPEKMINYCCILCGKESRNKSLNRCVDCGGAMDAIYNLSNFSLPSSINPLERYFSLLPVMKRENLLWFGEGNTPCIHARKLGKKIGLFNLYLKDETTNPTRSTKDRIASVGLSRFKELDIHHLVVASTGNSSVAYARGVQMVKDFKVDIFVAKHFLHRLNYVDHPRIRTYVGDSDFVGAGSLAKRHAEMENTFFEGGFFSLSRREGLKLTYLEAFDQLPAEPEYVFQAVSSGMGLLGAYKGAIEYKALGRLSTLPALFAVQQESCNPMARAFKENQNNIQSHHIIENPTGIAEAILRGDPTLSYPYIRSICSSTNGQILSVSEKEMRLARKMLIEREGLYACYASTAALAGAIKIREAGMISSNSLVLVNITGANRPFSPVPARVQYISSVEAA